MGKTERKLTKLKRLLLTDGLNTLAEFLKCNANKFSFEVRINGHAKVYYKKCLALDISPSGKFTINKRYFLDKDGAVISDDKFNDEWLRISKDILDKPEQYFNFISMLIDKWQEKKKNKGEFYVQQEIATHNRNNSSIYFIVDMEYKLSQTAIEINSRDSKINIYDLVAIDRRDNSIVLLEVKYGMGALENKSGAVSHYDKFVNEFFKSPNKEIFKKQLIRDVKNIINDKRDLGFISFDLPNNFSEIKFATIHVIKDIYNPQEKNWYNDKNIGEMIFITPPQYSIE